MRTGNALSLLAAGTLALYLLFQTACSGASAHESSAPSPTNPTSPTSPAGSPASSPTTTVAAETANNTSAPNTFAAQLNGNAGAGNVSKLPIGGLLYSGATTKVFAHWLPWFGSGSHINVGYRSDDPAQVHRQVDDMVSRGIQGAVVDWFGPNATVENTATELMRKEAESHPGFEFAIMEDAGALFNAAVANGCDVTDQLISDLRFIASQFLSSPAYMHLNGKMPIFMFGVNGFFVDWQRAQASVPGNVLLLFRGQEGFQQSFANGGFQWVDINSPDAFDPQLSAQDAFYTAGLKSGRTVVGSAYKGFFDPLAAWGTNRQIHHRCGQTWLDTFADVSKFFSTSNQLAALQVVTWNDYEEGSSIESGIDNCVFLVPSISGNTLNWSVGGGPEATIDHFTVFSSTDGQNLAKLADVPAGTHSLDLSSKNLPAQVMLFVKATGKPSVRNVLSAPVAFRAGDKSPAASLAVTQAGDLTVQATANASDPDGSISSVSIDFGDGTVVNGTTASHKYPAVGSFNITATAVDNAGASAVAVARVEAKSSASGVTIVGPSNSATVEWPTPLVASANTANPVTRMQVFIDGQPAFATDRGVVNTALKVFRGPHHVTVQAFDSSGASSQSSVDVVAEPGDLPPTATISFRPLPNNTVLACGAASHDADGFILTYQWHFSDGTTFFTPAAVHTFAMPGSFSATLDVTDQFGAPASLTQSGSASGAATIESLKADRMRQTQTAAPARQFEPIRRP